MTVRRVMLPVFAALGFAAAIGAAPRPARDADRLEAALAGMTPGRPDVCLMDRGQVQRIEGYGPTLLYRVSPTMVYRNDTAGDCGKVARGDILVTRSVTGGRSCHGDIARTVSQTGHVETGSCSLGDFVPYRRAPLAKARP